MRDAMGRRKRLLDIACVLLAVPLVLPLMALIAVGIRLVSTGPIFFRQERVGYLGRRFQMLKFRSMRHQAATDAHRKHLQDLIRSRAPMTKMDRHGDDRLIPWGALLRATGLDELPQLINVLRGDMSLVGPRPSTPYEFEEYEEWHKERLNTLPGLTGLWQVSGKNGTTFDEMMRLDVEYVRSLSLRRDLGIMARTVPVLCGQIADVLSRNGRKRLPDKAPTDQLSPARIERIERIREPLTPSLPQ